VHWSAGEAATRWTYAALIAAAREIAAQLAESGVKRGDVCAIIMRHHPMLYPLYAAVCCLGAVPAILAYPNARLHPDKFRQGIEGMAERSGLDWILTERDLECTIRPCVERSHGTIKAMHFPLEWPLEQRSFDSHRPPLSTQPSPFDACLLQHSSGTTGLQKPVLLSHAAVLEHVRAYGNAIGLSAQDKVISWLPLYHDMGLIAAFHLPLAFGISSVQIDPFEWVVAPFSLLDAVAKERGTISWLPNFAFNMMADKIRDDELAGVDLGSWRLIVNCSEPIKHASNLKFVERFRRCGLRPAAISSCYAMAEATFAVTQTPLDSAPARLTLDRQALARRRVQLAANGDTQARVVVSSGTRIEGCELRILDDNRVDLGEDHVGEIAIKSSSLFDGYRNYPEKTAEVVRDGWYFTGDYGFRHGDDYYVVGRKKDTIIVAGNNISPEDIEDIVGQVDGILPGRVVAFGEDDDRFGSEQIAVIAETTIVGEREQKALRLEIVKAGMTIDVSIAKIYLAPPRWLIKSSAGKPSRGANKQRVSLIPSPGEKEARDYKRIEKGPA
jgi:acyl-CoA synthetase (AMP-forming)/AMP-acid ligase II